MQHSISIALITILFSGFVTSVKYDHLLWPYPQKVDMKDQFLLIHDLDKFQIITKSKCDVIESAIKRYMERMFIQDCRRLNPKFAGSYFIPKRIDHQSDPNYKGLLKNVTLIVDGGCEQYPHMNMNEMYQIFIQENGIANIHAKSVWGAIRGLETFSRLLINTGRDEFLVNIVSISDVPRFSHRGVLVDTSRHYQTINVIKQMLDAMELNKMNVLHWHIVDDQSFPFVSDTFPELSFMGAYDPVRAVYTPRNISHIIEYARLRGIRVMAEFDSPGHTLSWGRGHPELLTQCYGSDGKPNGQKGPIDPIKNEVYTFMEKLFTEIAHRFPEQYIHLGGDEVNPSCWLSNPSIINFMTKHNMARNIGKLETYYIQKIVDIVSRLNKSYIVWQEVFDNNVTLKSDTVVHVWLSAWQNELAKVTQKGHKALLSAPWYLDLISYGQDWVRYYQTDPTAFNGSDEQKRLLMGGEACLWAEFIDSANLIQRAWPRASAVAERLWSPASLNKADRARPRFHENECHMQRNGLHVEPSDGPGYCQCDIAL